MVWVRQFVNFLVEAGYALYRSEASYSIHGFTAKSQSLDVTVLGHETGCFAAISGNVFACSCV